MRALVWILGWLACLLGMANDGLQWLNKEYDFGTIYETDGPQAGIFKAVNRGSKPVEIESVRPSCGCTEAEYTQGEVAKGDTLEIKVVFDPEERPGKFDKGIKVFFKDSDDPEQLKIKGTVVAGPETLSLFYPVSKGDMHFDTPVVEFGEITQGHRRREFVDIYNSGKEALRPQFTTDSEALSLSLQPEEIKPGEGATLTIYLDTVQIIMTGKKNMKIKATWPAATKGTGQNPGEGMTEEMTIEVEATVFPSGEER